MASRRTRSSAARALLLAALAACAAAGPARADTPAAPATPAQEQRLRALETQTLGPGHAADHARQRELARTGAPSAVGDPPPPESDPAERGRWGAAFPLPVFGVHAALLPTGKVLLWSRETPTGPARERSEAWLWDPKTGATKQVDPPLFHNPITGKDEPANIWCSGQSHLPDGQILVAGGNLAHPDATAIPPRPNFAGTKTVYTFNPFNETWTPQPEMAKGRWYPTQTLLPTGRTVFTAGLDETGTGLTNKEVEIFSPPATPGGQGSLAKLGDRGGLGQPPDGEPYPHTAVLPSGRMLVAGPGKEESWFLHDPGAGNVPSFELLPDLDRWRLWGTGVLRPGGPEGSTRYSLVGGAEPDWTSIPRRALAVPSSITFDESDQAAGWKQDSPLNIGRGHHNTVLLPDRSMVTVGGGLGNSPAGGPQQHGVGLYAANDEQRQVELFDPDSQSWRLGAAQSESRAYHSTALLLPDGRVLSSGDDSNGGTEQDSGEIYEPPYLFRGPRPQITSAPAVAQYGTGFHVESSGPAPARAVLIAPGAVTHANDMSQRTVELALEKRSDGVRLTPPSGATLAPPGYYMLFLVSAEGVPSEARFVRLGTDPPSPGRLEVAQSTADGSGRFSFDQGPLDSFWLSGGQMHASEVPPGTRTVRQTSGAEGYKLRYVGCSDGTPGSLPEASVTVDIASGQTVRCAFVNSRDPTSAKPPPRTPPAKTPPAKKPPAVARDQAAPSISFSSRRGLRGRRELRGRVSDASGVRLMQAAVTGSRRGRCRVWSPRRRRLGRASRRACTKPGFFRAGLRRSGSGYAWAAALRARVPRGRYVIRVRAEDAKGNVAQRRFVLHVRR